MQKKIKSMPANWVAILLQFPSYQQVYYTDPEFINARCMKRLLSKWPTLGNA